MPQRNLEDELNEAFKKFQQEARDKAAAEGKREVIQEEFDSNPVVRLKNIYDRLIYVGIGFHVQDKYPALKGSLQQFGFSIEDARYFHELNKNDSLEYALFMCAVADTIKAKGKATYEGTELHPYFESAALLPQLFFLADPSHGAKVKFQDLDTVVLTACEWASTREFNAGNLVLDCKLGDIWGSIGEDMTGGKITVTKNVNAYALGSRMKGGTILYEGQWDRGDIGEKMEKGDIIINGGVRGRSDIGREMINGNIEVNGDVIVGAEGDGDIGYQMKGGTVTIDGIFVGLDSRLGGHKTIGFMMEGGKVYLKKGAKGDISIGPAMKDGYISVEKECRVASIGDELHRGLIRIYCDAGTNIGYSMNGGLIDIQGSAIQYNDKGELCGVGNYMKGGEINIARNAVVVGNEMEGGTINIGGDLSNKTEFIQKGGQVYVRGNLIRPKLFYRIMGNILKRIE